MEPGGLERMAASGAINRSNLQRPSPPAFHSQTNLQMNQHTFEDSPPYSLLSDGGSGSNTLYMNYKKWCKMVTSCVSYLV